MSFLTLPETKEFLEIDYSTQDLTIQTLIDGIEEWIEEYCALFLTNASRTDDVDGGGRSLWPKNRPVTSITSVTIIVDGEDEELINSEEYRLSNDQVIRNDESRWRTGKIGQVNRSAYRVISVGGHSSGGTPVPAGLKLAMLQLIFRQNFSKGGKSRQGAAGFGVDWQALLTSDPMVTLNKYIAHGMLG